MTLHDCPTEHTGMLIVNVFPCQGLPTVPVGLGPRMQCYLCPPSPEEVGNLTHTHIYTACLELVFFWFFFLFFPLLMQEKIREEQSEFVIKGKKHNS